MSNVLNDLIISEKLDLYLNDFDKEKLLNILVSIDEFALYKSPFHGLYHSEKVLLFAYLLAKHFSLNELGTTILFDAAIYHDIGRTNEFEDTLHGYASSNMIKNIVKNKIYETKENLEILKFICDAHSVSDEKLDQILGNYEINDKELARKLAYLLKDSDALDRARFQKTSYAALKTCYLRSEYAKELVGFAHKVNNYYQNKINERCYSKFSKLQKKELITCFHGIGFNFATLDSILEYGILSNYAKKNMNLTPGRNYSGYNGDNFISVSVGNGISKSKFIDSGISFEVEVDNLINGEIDVSKAKSEGLPINSKLYDDEMFAFYKIDKESIKNIIVNPDYLNLNIKDLNYLNCSNNYENIVSNIDTYLNYFRINFNYFPDITKIEKLKAKYLELIISYEKMSEEKQKLNQDNLFVNTDKIKNILNNEIGLMFNQIFSNIFNKTNIITKDVLRFILEKHNLNYEDFLISKFK